ncbi:MAG TPA: hypothetical protein ENN84_11830, partial [Candidatus Marinimicrobia bacterium]|nr:hypothetical protein [Candidatus Neomarinimicrobiota bacterium]
MNTPIPNSSNKLTQIKIWVYTSGVIILIFGMMLSWSAVRAKDTVMRAESLQQAHIVSRTIKAQWIKELSGTEADLGTALYERLKYQMSLSRETNTHWEWLYVMGRNANGEIFFYVDSEPDSDEDASPAGQIYDEATKELIAIFDTGEAIVEGPVSDSWGLWISPLIPITDPLSNEVIGVFGIDITADTWRKIVWRAAIFPAANTLLLLILLFSGYHLMTKRRSIG